MHSLSVEDKLAVHELLAKVSAAIDDHAIQNIISLFTENATFSIRIAGGDLIGPFEGRDSIISMMDTALSAQSDKRRHLVSNIFFGPRDQEGTVVVSSNLTLLSTEHGEITLLSAGVYHDRVQQVNGDWKLFSRHLDLDKSY